MNEPPEPDSQDEGTQRWIGLATLESIALAIALVSPVTPSKTGSRWSFAELFWEAPSYVQQVAVAFIVVNLLVVGIGVVAWIALKLGPAGD